MSGGCCPPPRWPLPQAPMRDKGKMVADPTHKITPSRWLHRLGDKGKMVSPLCHKMVLPSWPHGLGNKQKKDGRWKEPLQKGKTLWSTSVADEDLPWCTWHQRRWPLSPAACGEATSVGANVILAAGVCVGEWVCWHHMGWPSPRDQFKLCHWWDLQSSLWKQFVIVKCSFSDWPQLPAQKATQSGVCAFGRCCQAEEQVGLCAAIFSSNQHLLTVKTIPVLAEPGLKETVIVFGYRWIWNTITFWFT